MGVHFRAMQTVAVKEERDGETVWEGKVEVFGLWRGIRRRAQCYAWGYIRMRRGGGSM